MKLLLSWIFEHIDANWSSLSLPDFIDQFNRITAEIDRIHEITTPRDSILWAQIIEKSDQHIVVFVPTKKDSFSLPIRNDLVVDDWTFIILNESTPRWATGADVGGSKEFLFPSLQYHENISDLLSKKDYVIEIDNKTISHRPDLWGHRGIAREVAAILGKKLKPIDQMIEKKSIKEESEFELSSIAAPFSLSLQAIGGCNRFAYGLLSHASTPPSDPHMAILLARIDCKPINTIVDITNYVMFDLGHPMHAFDQDLLPAKELTIRRARPREKMVLLDGDEISLISEDIVVSSNGKPLALAGVMGGKTTEISRTTKSILFEAAQFDATTIRRSALRHKKRTEASTRFEKSLDPNQATTALMRAAYLVKKLMRVSIDETLFVVGKETTKPTVTVSHSFLEKRLGTTLDSARVFTIVEPLEFTVQKTDLHDDTQYVLTVPTFRATKDISIPEDIVEEVGRFIGYQTIQPELPKLATSPKSLRTIRASRHIRELLSFGLRMREIQSYAFFDESFLKTMSWIPDGGNVVSIQNPVSDNWKRLCTTLVPHLLKAVNENCHQYDHLRFFEWGRVWYTDNRAAIVENKEIAGIFYSVDKSFDFYEGKDLLSHFFEGLRIPITWHQMHHDIEVWYEPYITATISCGGIPIGKAGMVPEKMMRKISQKGSAFVFELDSTKILAIDVSPKFEPLAKFPIVIRDMSMLIPKQITTATIRQLITSVDPRITKIDIVDFFEKDEWKQQRSITYRFHIYDPTKTLIKDEVDTILDGVMELLKPHGVIIR